MCLTLTLGLALAGCGDKAVTDAGTGTPATTTALSTAPSSTNVSTTTAGAGPSTTIAGKAAPTTTAAAAVTTTKKPGPSATDVADLERQLDDIDKTLSDIQTEINTN